ncbi:hypothetical protein B0H21DRAFT_827328 [Amylocystis lapponica]|nr:hypothetical protein B0H21DRAFT_827328 [Amylocystis lapponica]
MAGRTRRPTAKAAAAASSQNASSSTKRKSAPAPASASKKNNGGKKTSQSSGGASTPSNSQSVQNSAQMLKNLEARNKQLLAALQAQQDAEIQKRNAELLDKDDADENSSEGTQTPRIKKKKTNPAPLSEEERQLAAALGSSKPLTLRDEEAAPSEPLDDEPDGDDGEDVEGGEHGVVDLTTEEGNGTSTTSSTPSHGEKVTSASFTQISGRLAALSKAKTREYIATVNAFPTDKEQFCWSAIQDAAKASEPFRRTLEEAELDLVLKENLIDYAGYSIAGLRGDLKAKAKTIILGHYSLTAGQSSAEIKERVRWLLTKSNFMYGGLDIKNLTVNRQEPFKHPILVDIIRGQWFGKGKADVATMNKMITLKLVMGELIALVVTVVENALKEWIEGSYHTVNFSEDTSAEQYMHHLRSWRKMETQGPNWTRTLQSELFQIIVSNTNRQHLQAAQDDDDLDDLNFAELESAVVQN